MIEGLIILNNLDCTLFSRRQYFPQNRYVYLAPTRPAEKGLLLFGLAYSLQVGVGLDI